MPIDRPTFAESWYRVADLKPRLLATVRTTRQHFRGQLYHVIEDPLNNAYFRVDAPGYHFIGLLNGKRTIQQAWDIANDHLGDDAPTQNEAIELLGKLYNGNLIMADLPPDAEGMFRREAKRKQKEVGAYFTNILFARVPLFDPDAILSRWVTPTGWVFTRFGFVLWLALLVVAAYYLVGDLGRLSQDTSSLLAIDAEKAVLLYTCFIAIKAVHELGHGLACKAFGRRNHTDGAVHTLGVMFMVGIPIPYIDATSSWSFRSKWQRAYVGAAGMYTELGVAAIAAIVWAHTAPDTTISYLAHNVMFIASIATLLFNGNPLLRYDAYYILSDIFELPNLAQRSKEFLHYLVKRYAFGHNKAKTPVTASKEKAWLLSYAIASSAYRVFITITILLFVAGQMFMLGVLMAIVGLVTMVIVPGYKFVRFLLTGPELSRCRPRALMVTAGVIGTLLLFVGLIPVPDHERAEGVVEPVEMASVYMPADGFIERVNRSDTAVSPGAGHVLLASNPSLHAEREQVAADLRLTIVRRNAAMQEDPALQQSMEERLKVLAERLTEIDSQLASLSMDAPFEGVWVCPNRDQLTGVYLARGEQVGMVVKPERLLIRAVADQHLGPRLMRNPDHRPVSMRVKGDPGLTVAGAIDAVLEAGQEELPSAALGYRVGGQSVVEQGDQSGTKTSEPFFEVRIAPGEAPHRLRIGQRVVVRFDFGHRPLAAQCWRALRQMIQQRFNV